MACVSFARFLAEQVTGKLNSNFYSKGLIFLFTIYGGKREFAQWDLDHLVTCPCMQKGDKVFFYANGKNRSTTAYERDGEIVADVPNALLQFPGSIRIDLGSGLECHIDCRTEINITEREKPDGYCCTDNSNLTKKYIASTPQNLTEAEKAQVRENIGVGAGGGGGGKAVQTDWDQLDAAAADYLKNKPFGDAYIEIIPETEVRAEESDDGAILFFETADIISEPKGVNVKFDGVEYICYKHIVDGGAYYGNLGSFDGADTGEPFLIVITPYVGLAMLIPDFESHNIGISILTQIPIDKRYLPIKQAIYANGND